MTLGTVTGYPLLFSNWMAEAFLAVVILVLVGDESDWFMMSW